MLHSVLQSGVTMSSKIAPLTKATVLRSLVSQYIRYSTPSTTVPSSVYNTSIVQRNPYRFCHSPYRNIVTEIANTEMLRDKTATEKLVIVQYSASWCGPCRQIKPLITKMSNEEADVDFLYVDIDDHAALAEEAGIENVPTFILLKNGKEVEKIIGANAGKLREAVDKNK